MREKKNADDSEGWLIRQGGFIYFFKKRIIGRPHNVADPCCDLPGGVAEGARLRRGAGGARGDAVRDDKVRDDFLKFYFPNWIKHFLKKN